MKTKFYTYNQNNSGGSFIKKQEQGIDTIVIIEATSPSHADSIAEDKGIYFDGCSNGRDCNCCGDRWYKADEGYDVPSFYDTPITEVEEGFFRQGAFVHYLDGRIEYTKFKPKSAKEN